MARLCDQGCTEPNAVCLVDHRRRSENRFPMADPYERLLALRAKADEGGREALTEEDLVELEAIGAAIVEAFKPIAQAITAFGEQVGLILQEFMDSLSPELVAELQRLGQTHGEPLDSPAETVDIVTTQGILVDTLTLNIAPVSAVAASSRFAYNTVPVQEFYGEFKP